MSDASEATTAVAPEGAPTPFELDEAVVTVSDLGELPDSGPHVYAELGAAEATLIPGALRIGPEHLAGQPTATSGVRPLPEHAALAAALAAAGVTPGTRILLYSLSPQDLPALARAWVVLRWAGVPDVRVIIDAARGGLVAQAEQLGQRAAESTAQSQPVSPEDFRIDAGATVDLAQVRDRDETTIVVDARDPQGFGDEHGHIPGSVNIPAGLLLAGGGPAAPEAIRAILAERLGPDFEDKRLVTSCGAGIAASVASLALATAGIQAPVYIGSWSEWARNHAGPAPLPHP